MKAAFLDFATFGAKTLDLTPLYMRLPELQMFDDTSASLTASRIQNLEYVLTNKVKLTKKALQGAKNLCFILQIEESYYLPQRQKRSCKLVLWLQMLTRSHSPLT